MSTISFNIETLSAVHFSLRAPLPQSRMLMKSLRHAAKKIGFSEVGPYLSFSGEKCAALNDDPHTDFKIHARGFVIHEDKAVSFLPLSIEGFSVELKNGNLFHIGLCRYPHEIELPDGQMHRIPSSFVSQWMSYVHTTRLDQMCESDCAESHFTSLMLLREAERLGILYSVNDPYGQWDRPNSSSFIALCEEEKELAGAH